jgi:hypothetical protein
MVEWYEQGKTEVRGERPDAGTGFSCLGFYLYTDKQRQTITYFAIE